MNRAVEGIISVFQNETYPPIESKSYAAIAIIGACACAPLTSGVIKRNFS